MHFLHDLLDEAENTVIGHRGPVVLLAGKAV